MIRNIKSLIAGILTLPVFGRLIKLLSGGIIQKNEFRFNIISDQIDLRTIALLYFGLYESCELRFVSKYLRSDLPIIELGTSLGIVSTYCRKRNPNRLICVEVNPLLIPEIKKNFELNHIENYEIINTAVGQTEREIFFEPGKNNISGGLTQKQNESSLKVDVVALSTIVKNSGIAEYILVCDIEGSEALIINYDSLSLENCRQIIIETHAGEYDGLKFTPSSLKDDILRLGFTLTAEYGPNYVFDRID